VLVNNAGALADPASDDAEFYQHLLSMGGLVSLCARENFPLIRIEALQACERMTVDGFKMDAFNELQAKEPLFKPSESNDQNLWMALGRAHLPEDDLKVQVVLIKSPR
jgi:hypothetical protein